MQFYQNLEVIRKQANKTQKEIAELLNTTQQQYSKYEKGQQELPIRHLITLSEYYNITTDEVLGIRENRYLFTNAEIDILKKYKALKDIRKGRVLQMIDMLLEEQEKESIK